MRHSLMVAGVLVLIAAAGCGGSIRDGDGTSPLGASALAGTWDLTATPTARSASTSGSLVIQPSSLELTVGGQTLKLEGTGSAITLTSTQDVDVTHEPAALDTGALPLDVGGIWSATSADGAQQCHARLTKTAFSGDCTAVDTGAWGLSLHGAVTGTRLRALASSFGDLGGQWYITQGDTTCNATFEGNDLSVTCMREGAVTGSLSAHVTDSLASGTSSDGTEFAARRRGPTG
jgi:hypothetical protein